MKLAAVLSALEALCPLALAEEWDNVGLLTGDPEAELERALACIDLTHEVLDEAQQRGAGLVLAYHPPLFRAVKRLAHDDVTVRAARLGVAVWSPHTALDLAAGGTCDALAESLELQLSSPLRPHTGPAREVKLVTFVPELDVGRVSEALFAAGAGRIGNYSACSFRTSGTGTFFGEEGASPVVGQAGRLELAPEVRLETVVPRAAIAAVVRALRESHPYEEPAFDLLTLDVSPSPEVGMGRIGTLAAGPLDEQAFVAHVKDKLSQRAVLTAGASPRISRVAVGPGSCGELFRDALARGAHAYVTGELGHHHALEAARAGLFVVLLRHSESERPGLARLAASLAERTGLTVTVSARCRDPLSFA
jgi:dinuclear metal center YbgI/SA1388 family protein